MNGIYSGFNQGSSFRRGGGKGELQVEILAFPVVAPVEVIHVIHTFLNVGGGDFCIICGTVRVHVENDRKFEVDFSLLGHGKDFLLV